MTNADGRPYASEWLDDDRSMVGQDKVVARFASVKAAQDAALALQRAGYHPTVARAEWQPLLPVLLGALAGSFVGRLPITRALGSVLFAVLCTLLGGWLGYRWQRDEVEMNATRPAGDTRARYAVAVRVAGGAPDHRRDVERVQRILEEHDGRGVEVRKVA